MINRIIKGITQPKISQVASKVRQRNLTYLSDRKISNLETCIKEVAEKSVPGFFLEAGIALGGSAIIITSLMESQRIFHGYDVFEMIPSPTEEDDNKSKTRYEVIKSGNSKGLGNNPYYGYIDDLYTKVINNFKEFGLEVDSQKIFLHQGLFQDTMIFEPQDRVAFAHIDCDWYQPVKFCLETIYNVLSPQGYIVLDDYHDYGGCKKAVHEFLATRNDMTIVIAEGNLVLRREFKE